MNIMIDKLDVFQTKRNSFLININETNEKQKKKKKGVRKCRQR
jgi:hypothetical protein